MKKTFISRIGLLVSILFFIGMMLSFTACTDRSLTGNTNIRIDDLKISIGQVSREGLVYAYLWDGTEEGLVIDIPDVTDHNEKITELGGYANIGVPALFGISIKPFDDGFDMWTGPYGKPLEEGTEAWNEMEEARREYMENTPLYGRIVEYQGEDETLYDAPISYDKMVFTINLNKYINSVKLDYGWTEISGYLGIRQDDGSIVFYEPAAYFTCDEENETYYAVDGRLYLKETNELVELNPGFDYP